MVYDPGPLALLQAERQWHGPDCPVCPKRHNPNHDKDGKFAPAPGGAGGLTGRAAIEKTFTHTDAETGMSYKVKSVSTIHDSVSAFDGYTQVKIRVKTKLGLPSGHGEVLISPDGKHVHHSDMVLGRGVQGQGFATRQMLHIVGSYKEHGVERMTIHANADVGGYAWARAGFKFEHSGARATVADHARRQSRKYDPGVQQEIERVSSNRQSSPIDFAMIGHTAGSKMWPGKEIMLGSSWDGQLDL